MQKMTWDAWLHAMALNVLTLTGMSYKDLPDMPFRDMYDDGMSPIRAAKKTVRYAKDEY